MGLLAQKLTKNLSPPTVFELEVPSFVQKQIRKNAGSSRNVFFDKCFISPFFKFFCFKLGRIEGNLVIYMTKFLCIGKLGHIHDQVSVYWETWSQSTSPLLINKSLPK